jgi:hypothetical protein
MMIFSGDTVTEYGLTPAGQFFEMHQVGKTVAIMRTTPDPERFLRWMIQSEVDRELEDEQRERLIKVLQIYWTLIDGDILRGSFNKELYLQIIEVKRKNGTLYR